MQYFATSNGQARQVAPHHRLVDLLPGLPPHHPHSLFARAPRTRDDEACAEPRQARQVAGQRERQHSLVDALGAPHRPPHRPRDGWRLCAEQRPRLLASLPPPPPPTFTRASLQSMLKAEPSLTSLFRQIAGKHSMVRVLGLLRRPLPTPR